MVCQHGLWQLSALGNGVVVRTCYVDVSTGPWTMLWMSALDSGVDVSIRQWCGCQHSTAVWMSALDSGLDVSIGQWFGCQH